MTATFCHPERSEGSAALYGALTLLLAVTTSVSAQGTLSTQGLGFPPGQLSTSARTMGGATGEADPFSPLNPAAIGLLPGAVISMQAEPEYRTIEVGSLIQRTSVARFPLFQGAATLGSRWGLGISTSTLLDRTWETTVRDTQIVGGDPIPASLTERSDGSIVDTRFSVSYSVMPWLRVGVGGHAYSGRDQLHTIRAFDDTDRFATDTQRTTLSFGGNAVSVGAVALVGTVGVVGVSYRAGGGISSKTETETVGTGSVPDHYGITLIYTGIRGAALAARAAKDSWSSLADMADNLHIHEDWDLGLGAEITGPSVGANTVAFRLGGRWRTLPFSANADAVKEQTYSLGFSLPMARNRIELNVGGLYALRSNDAVSGINERAWTLSTGFSVRP